MVLAVALCMVYFGYINFLQGFGGFRMPSMTPIASLYAAIPISGVLIALFTVEQLVNGWRHCSNWAEPAHEEISFPMTAAPGMSNGWILIVMGALFLALGYIGVPVAFSLTAGVLVATMLTSISLPATTSASCSTASISQALLAVPFFLLVGELMTSANVVERMIILSQSMIGHLRGGLAHQPMAELLLSLAASHE